MHLTVSVMSHGSHPAAWLLSPDPAAVGPERLRAAARTAERGLLDAVLLGPGFGGARLRSSGAVDRVRLDALPAMASLIALTERIGLGAALPLHHAEPYNVARSFATLDRLSGGRSAWIAQGFAAGDRADAFTQPATPRTAAEDSDRAIELIDVARALWDSWEDAALRLDKATGQFADPDRVHRLDHAGRYFTVRGPLNVPRPIQGQPVVIQTDTEGETGRRVAACSADVVLCRAGSLAEARSLYGAMKLRAAVAARAPADLRVMMEIMPILGATEAAAQRRAAELDGFVTADLAATLVADWVQLDRQAAPSRHMTLARLWPGCEAAFARRALDPAMTLHEAARHVIAAQTGLTFVGTPDGLAALMQAWRTAGVCDGFNIQPAVLPDDLDRFVDGVVPILRGQGLVRDRYAGSTLREHLGLPRPASRFATGERGA